MYNQIWTATKTVTTVSCMIIYIYIYTKDKTEVATKNWVTAWHIIGVGYKRTRCQ